MSKSIKLIAVIAVAVIIVSTLCSCGGGLSGTYEREYYGNTQTLTFNGDKMEMEDEYYDIIYVYKYSIDGDEITLSLQEFKPASDSKSAKEEAEHRNEQLKEMSPFEYSEIYVNVESFEQDEDWIKIDGIKYTKK